MEARETEPLDVAAVREDFPILERRVGGEVTPGTVGEDVPDGEQLVYLDNAATTQTPEPVIEAISEYYRRYNANVHRGLHHLSQEASVAYELAHDRVADFVGASGEREEIVFTGNTTEAENLVAYAWGLRNLGPGDRIVLTQMEHHSSLVTWQQIGKRTGADVEYVRVRDDGRLDLEHAQELIDSDAAIVSAVHVSNTLGTVNPVSRLADLAHDNGALVFVDGAQAVPTRPVDVEAIDADFYAFSGHKMAGPTGIGVLYGKRHLLEEMDPFLYGGDMIGSVDWEDATWNELPWKFEAGTPKIAQAIALDAAIDYLDDLGMGNVREHEELLAAYAHERISELDDVQLFGPEPGPDRGGLVAFAMDDVHAHDVASIVNDRGVAIRAGHHCTQPLHGELGVPATARASFYVYNTREEVDVLLEGLEDARELLG